MNENMDPIATMANNKMKIFFAILILSLAFNVNAQPLAQTPPMGWNSYNCFGSAVHEDEVKANADYMAKHLKQVRMAIYCGGFSLGL